MKRFLTMAISIVLALGVGTALHAELSVPDVGIPDVPGVPEVGAGQETARQPSIPDTVIRRKPAIGTYVPVTAAKQPSGAIPEFSVGAGVAATFASDSATTAGDSTFLSMYLEWYPLTLWDVLGIGMTMNYDLVPIESGDMVIGAQADARWVFTRSAQYSAWVDCRVGPAYESGSNSLRLYGYMDLGFDLILGKTALETRIGGYLTGTATGWAITMGMEL